MSESKIQVSFKLPNGTIPLFRGDTTEEVETLITAAVTSETFVGTLEAFAEAAGIGKPTSAPQPVFQNQQAVANVAAALGGTVISETTSGPFKTCLHGRMTAMQGVSKFQAGEIYKSYMCPAPKGALDKCKSISLRKGTPEWEAFVPDKLAK